MAATVAKVLRNKSGRLRCVFRGRTSSVATWFRRSALKVNLVEGQPRCSGPDGQLISVYTNRSSVQKGHHRTMMTGRGIVSSTNTRLQAQAADLCGQQQQLVISSGRRTLRLTTADATHSFNATWLRHNCHCGRCKQAHSGQRLLEPSTMRPTYTLRSAALQEGEVILEWDEDGHVTSIPLAFLIANDYSEDSRRLHCRARTPSVATGTFPSITYSEIMSGDQGIFHWLQQLNDYGISMVEGMPTEKGTIKKVVEQIWPIQSTIYGEVFDVVSTDEPINVAYSSAALGLHMDLAYYESPPGYQFLHCLSYDDCISGGESYFVDAWPVIERLRAEHPTDFATLVRIPATFQKIHYNREVPVHMTYQRPHIVLGVGGQLTAINWSPPFEGPLNVAQEDVEPYYIAYHRLASMLETADSKIETCLKPGDMIGFNNRRVLHARKAFNLAGGSRHLQGCYVNIDELKSRTEVLSRTVGDGKPMKRVFNQCGF